MKTVVVIPTYNESETIAKVIDLLAEDFKKIPNHDMHILVVDDSSPDGTADIVREKMKEYPFVHLYLNKEKLGLGGAYARAFKYAIEKLGAEVIMEMDGDLQHDPNDVHRFMEQIDEGYDFVIGSRFIAGGSIPEEWGFKRKFFSIVGNWVSKIVMGIYDISEFTNGFRATRVKGFMDRIDLDNFLSSGFAYKLDLLFKFHRLGAKMREIPVKFGHRDYGESKMERNNPIDSLRVVLTLRIQENIRFVKFCIVGFVGLFTDSASFNLLRITALSSGVSSLLSGLIGMLTTFTLNNYWSFGDRKIEGTVKKTKSFGIYIISSYIPILVRSKLVDIANVRYGDTLIVSNIAFFIGIAFGLVWNYLVYSKIIWKEGSNGS
jgi:dolichol-phosphate mannosyltransferase